MATVFDWVKLGLDNSKVIYPVIVLLLSVAGLSTYNTIEVEGELEASNKQVAEVANYYISTRKLKPEPVIKNDCDSCRELIIQHNREFHE